MTDMATRPRKYLDRFGAGRLLMLAIAEAKGVLMIGDEVSEHLEPKSHG